MAVSIGRDFIARVDRDSNTRWLDGRFVALHKPEQVRVSFWTLHPDDDCELVWATYQLNRADAAATVRAARRDGRKVERSIRGFEVEQGARHVSQ